MATIVPFSFDSNNTDNNNTTFLNSDILVGNTDDTRASSYLKSHSRLLPFSIEITDKIISYAYYLDAPHVIPNTEYYLDRINNADNGNNEPFDKKVKISSSSKNLMSGRCSNLNNLTLVNSGFHYLCLQYQYKYCKFIRSFSFNKFLLNLMKTNDLGNYVKTLDFQEFTAIGLGKSVESIFKIPNLTSITLLECLKLCSQNLETLLLNESIDTDINLDILHFIFNNLKNLKSLDFCGSSNDNFIEYFNNLDIQNDLVKIQNLSFHECLNFPTITFDKILLRVPNLKKLDLSHTQITLKSLNKFLNKNIRLTHLSLRKCSQLGSITEFIKFLKNPSICGSNETDMDSESDEISGSNSGLVWLNIQHCFSSDALTSERLGHIIEIIVNGSPNLKYLNLNGYGNLSGDHLLKIGEKLQNLESLNVSDINLDFNDFNDLEILRNLNLLSDLKFLDLSSSLWSFTHLKNVIEVLENVEVFEVKPFLTDKLSNNFKVKVYRKNDEAIDEIWRVYNNKGISRRGWIHKISSYQENELYDNYENEIAGVRLVEWDTESGDLILRKVLKVDWLGLACVKINCNDSESSTHEVEFGSDTSVRGLYKYYSLNV